MFSSRAAAEPLWVEPTSFPGDPDNGGFWDGTGDVDASSGPCIGLQGWGKVNPVHAALLYADGFPEGKIVLFNNTQFKIYDPAVQNSETDVHIGSAQEPFCAGHTMLPDGRLLIAGGNWIDKISYCPEQWIRSKDGWAAAFNPYDNTFEFLDEMSGAMPNDSIPGEWNASRYYPTCTALPDGSVLTVAGDYWQIDANGNGAVDSNESVRNTKWLELRPQNSDFTDYSWTEVTNAVGVGQKIVYYPNMLSTPVGLWWEGHHSDPTQSPPVPAESHLWPWPYQDNPAILDTRTEPQRITANMVMMSLEPPDRTTTIALIGGGKEIAGGTSEGPRDTIEWITYDPGNLGSASWTDPAAPGVLHMAEERRRPDSVMLPTGHVLIMGGESDEGDSSLVAHTPSLTCEVFDPDNPDSLLPMAELMKPRMYHSQALLLTDGRVWMSGNLGENVTGAGHTYEIFYPPYLFSGGSLRSDRPVIETAPDSIYYGQPFFIETDVDAATIDEVCLMHPSAITHATDMGQRRILLEFAVLDDSTLAVTAPPDSTFGSIGDYVLFIVQPDSGILQKVPSEGRFLRLTRCDNEIASGESEVWAGTVRLTSTFTVQSGGQLEILPGTEIYVALDVPVPVELSVLGTMLANGAPGSGIVFDTYEGTGAWDGIRFLNASEDTVSSLRYVTVRGATYGLTLDTVSPDIIHCTFEGNVLGDIHLDRDTEIPEGHAWQLDAPTRVVSETSSAVDLGGGLAGKIDILVQGDLQTLRQPGGSGWVVFTSTEENEAFGVDWAGITVMGTCTLRDADVGYAVHPVSLMMATDPVVSDARVHHYFEQGIYDWQSDATIERCSVEQGTGLSAFVKNSGIVLFKSVGTVEADTISFHPNYGIRAAFDSSYCAGAGSGGSPDTLLILGNVVRGATSEPQAENLGDPETGISLAWLCQDNFARVESDSIWHWSTGLSLEHCADTWLRYEAIQDNFVGIQYERGSELDTAEGPVHVDDNCIRSNYGIGLRSASALGLIWGGAYTYAPVGNNTVRLDPDSSATHNPLFFSIDDVGGSRSGESLVSGNNAWLGRDGTVVQDSVSIMEHVQLLGADDVVLSPTLASETDCSTPASETRAGPTAALMPDEDAGGESVTGAAPQDALPTRWRLYSTGGNPVRGRMEVGYEGVVEVRLFDVRGRKVATLASGATGPGRFQASLPGLSGGAFGSGVYFLRIDADGYGATQKVVLLR